MGMVTVAERRYAENTHEYTARPRSSPMMVGIAVETTVDSSEASAVTRTSAKVTARTRSGAKRAPGSTATTAASSEEAGKRPIIGHPAAKEGPTKTRLPAVLGLRAHSGWAALVAVGGSLPAPEVVDRRRIEMAAGPEAKQPYHAAEELPLPKAAALLERLSRQAQARAAAGLGAALQDLRAEGYDVVRMVILAAAGRPLPPLESVLASHALIHTADGEHFRDALAAASEGLRLRVTRIREKELLARAEAALRRPAKDLQAVVTAWGKALGPPWTQDQKLSALAAWTALADPRS